MKLYTSQICPPYDNDWICTDENYEADTDEGHWVGRGIVGED